MRTDHIIEILLSLIIGYLLYLILAPFFIPIFWGVVFVIVFYPYYRGLSRRVKNKTFASLIACATIGFFLILPMVFVGTAIANEVVILYQWAEDYLKAIQARAHNSPVFVFPYVEKYLGRYIDVSAVDLRNLVAEAVKDVSAYLTEGIKVAVKSFAGFVFNIILSFFTMFFLFRDGDKFLAIVKEFLPLSEAAKERVITRNRAVISATFYGGVVVGALQGFLGGIAFWYLGLPASTLWGFAMFIMSFLPGLGTVLVWGPASIYLFFAVSYAKGIMLFLWGSLIIGVVDNILRQAIVSGKTDLNPLLLFFSVLGGVNVFGLIGVIAGPLILCLAQSAIEIYRDAIKEKRV